MQVVESFSATRAHPVTLVPTRAIVFKFSTGHTLTRFHGGFEWFTTKSGGALNPVVGAKLVAAMKALT